MQLKKVILLPNLICLPFKSLLAKHKAKMTKRNPICRFFYINMNFSFLLLPCYDIFWSEFFIFRLSRQRKVSKSQIAKFVKNTHVDGIWWTSINVTLESSMLILICQQPVREHWSAKMFSNSILHRVRNINIFQELISYYIEYFNDKNDLISVQFIR